MIRTAALGLLFLAAPPAPVQERAGEKETWVEWLQIPSPLPIPTSHAGWRCPPTALEFGTVLPLPQLLPSDRPLAGGRLLLIRGAILECWDLPTRRLAWRLPSLSGFLGWTLNNSRVSWVFPRGPAARAGIVEGDVVVSIRRKVDPPSAEYSSRFRAGEKLVADLSSVGGRREVEIDPQPAPEPFGFPPYVEGSIGDDLLIGRDGNLERLRLTDGRILWSLPGRLLTQAPGVLLLQNSRGQIQAVEADRGTIRWSRDVPEDEYAVETLWTAAGPVVCWSGNGDFRVERLDPSTGRTDWSFHRRSQQSARSPFFSRSWSALHEFRCGRLFVTTSDESCQPNDFGWGVPRHEGPTCLIYSLFDLRTGELLWSRRTGGRGHGGTSRHEAPAYIPFDPALGGTGAAWQQRILWFDVVRQELSVIDPATLREDHRIQVAGAMSFAETGPTRTPGLKIGGETLWFDPATGGSRLLSNDLVPDEQTPDGSRLLSLSGSGAGEKPELRAFDGAAVPPKLLWSRNLPAGDSTSMTSRGPRILVHLRPEKTEADWFGLIETATGKEIWSETFDNPYFWIQRSGHTVSGSAMADPFLAIATTRGIHVYRRSPCASR